MKINCPFCSVSQERILSTNKHCLAIADSFPISQGHTLIVPHHHMVSIFELSVEERASIWQLVENVRNQLTTTLHPDGFNIGINDGSAAGQTIGHAHVHVIPRYNGDIVDPRGGIRWIMPEKANYWHNKNDKWFAKPNLKIKTLIELIDGASDCVALFKSESPAQIIWKHNWLNKANTMIHNFWRKETPSALAKGRNSDHPLIYHVSAKCQELKNNLTFG